MLMKHKKDCLPSLSVSKKVREIEPFLLFAIKATTCYEGGKALARKEVTKWVRLKFDCMNLRQYGSQKTTIFFHIYSTFSHYIIKPCSSFR